MKTGLSKDDWKEIDAEVQTLQHHKGLQGKKVFLIKQYLNIIILSKTSGY